MADIYKRSILINLRSLQCLNKYLFEKKDNHILEKDSENKYAAKNKN